jgi:hypothetical protein
MKKVSMKIAMAALLIAVGTIGLQAQSTKVAISQDVLISNGTCLYLDQLTADQIAILDELDAEFQAEMDILSAALVLAVTKADKAAIRATMTSLRVAHLAEVEDLLELWGVK